MPNLGAEMDKRSLPETCTVKDLAQIMNVCTKTIYNRIEDGTIPICSRVGRGIRISRETVENILSGKLLFQKGMLYREPAQPLANGVEGCHSLGAGLAGGAHRRPRCAQSRKQTQPPANA